MTSVNSRCETSDPRLGSCVAAARDVAPHRARVRGSTPSCRHRLAPNIGSSAVLSQPSWDGTAAAAGRSGISAHAGCGAERHGDFGAPLRPTRAGPHEWADLLGGGHGCGAMGVAPWCGANANYTSHADFRLGYYLGAWAAAASGSINVSGMSTEARIDRPFLYKSCPRSSCGAVPQKDACVHYAEGFAELLRDVGMGDDCIRLPVMWGDRSTSMAGAAGASHASKATTTMWAGDPMTVPTLVKTRRRNARVAGILLKLETWRHWDFLSETPPLSARLSWADRKDALVWRGSSTGRCAGCTHVRQRFVDELAGTHEGIDVAFGEDSHMMGEDSHRMSEEDMRQYRYTLSLEGMTSRPTSRKLASGLVVLMPTPTTESWLMEFALQPGVHYVAVETPADVPVKPKSCARARRRRSASRRRARGWRPLPTWRRRPSCSARCSGRWSRSSEEKSRAMSSTSNRRARNRRWYMGTGAVIIGATSIAQLEANWKAACPRLPDAVLRRSTRSTCGCGTRTCMIRHRRRAQRTLKSE